MLKGVVHHQASPSLPCTPLAPNSDAKAAGTAVAAAAVAAAAVVAGQQQRQVEAKAVVGGPSMRRHLRVQWTIRVRGEGRGVGMCGVGGEAAPLPACRPIRQRA